MMHPTSLRAKELIVVDIRVLLWIAPLYHIDVVVWTWGGLLEVLAT